MWYRTQINSWTQDGAAIVVETTTTITSAPDTATSAQAERRSQRQAARQADRQAARSENQTTSQTESQANQANQNQANQNPANQNPADQTAQTPPASTAEPRPEFPEATAPTRTFALTATLTSRQRFENQKIVQQEILSERTQLTAGDNPPTIDFNLPQQVRIGESFDFDAVVREPLGNRLLLGAALEEPIRTTGYLNPTAVNLEPLSAGGIFKVGRAPMTPENRWVSAVIVRDDGITAITQRLQVSPSSTPQTSSTP